MSRFKEIRNFASLAVLAVLLAAFPYSSNAEAHGRGHRGGYFFGGVVVGAAVFAPRYYYPAPYYYYGPPYYPYPPAVTYVAPPVMVQPAVPVPVQPPAQPPVSQLSIEDRLQRLRGMCDQGLVTEQECRTRREQILQEM